MSKKLSNKEKKRLVKRSQEVGLIKDYYIYTDETNQRKADFVKAVEEFHNGHSDFMLPMDEIKSSGNLELITRILYPQGMITVAHYDVNNNIAMFPLYKDTEKLNTWDNIQTYLQHTKLHIINNKGVEISLRDMYSELRVFDNMDAKSTITFKDTQLHDNILVDSVESDAGRANNVSEELLTKNYVLSDVKVNKLVDEFINMLKDKFNDFDLKVLDNISVRLYVFNLLFVNYKQVYIKMTDSNAFRPVVYEANVDDTFKLFSIIANTDDLIIEKWDKNKLEVIDKTKLFDKFMKNASVDNFAYELADNKENHKRFEKYQTQINDEKEVQQYRSVFILKKTPKDFKPKNDKELEQYNKASEKYEFDIVSLNQPVTDENGNLLQENPESSFKVE